MLETVVANDIDSLYRSVFENDTFFEIVTQQTYDDVKNFSITNWATSALSGERRRKMSYEFPKTIAFSRHEIHIEQVLSVKGPAETHSTTWIFYRQSFHER